MAKRFHESYAGSDMRRSQENADGGMIPSGSGSFSNMPQTLVMREYPKVGGWNPENINDSISGIDSQMGKDNSKKWSQIQKEKI